MPSNSAVIEHIFVYGVFLLFIHVACNNYDIGGRKTVGAISNYVQALIIFMYPRRFCSWVGSILLLETTTHKFTLFTSGSV